MLNPRLREQFRQLSSFPSGSSITRISTFECGWHSECTLLACSYNENNPEASPISYIDGKGEQHNLTLKDINNMAFMTPVSLQREFAFA